MQIRVKVRKKPDREALLLYYTDPRTGKEKSRSAGTGNRKDAEREALKWEAELLEHRGISNTGWGIFRERFEDEYLAFKAPATKAAYITALNAFVQRMKVGDLADVSASTMSTFAGKLKGEGYPNTTIKSYLTHVGVAFRWAERNELMRKAPHIDMPATGRITRMRGRPLTNREVAAMLRSCRVLHPKDFGEWRRLIKLFYFVGLRLGEAMELSWDRPPLQLNLDAKPYPLVLIDFEGQKGRYDTASPLPPDAVAWLAKVPRKQRKGLVVDVRDDEGKPYSLDGLSKAVGAIGEHAGVIVTEERPGKKKKYASAHDLRRTFGTRWALKVRPLTLQRMMRHKDLSTTLKFYIGLTAADVGAELWNGKQPEQFE